MYKKVLFIILYYLAAAPLAWAQQENHTVLEEIRIFEKFGDVDMETLSFAPDHSYPFEYLLKETSIQFLERSRSIVAEIDYLVRIRVYSDDPVEKTEAALVGIPFYHADGMESIRNLKGITHQPDGSRVHLNTDEARTFELNARYRIMEFEMPEVEQGSVIEYRYTLERRYIEELPDFHFSHRVPTRKARLFIKNEDFLRFDTIKENVNFEVDYHEERVDTSSIPMIFTYQRPDPVYIQIWNAENIPAVDASSYISSLDDLRGKLKFQVSEFGYPRQPLENSWEYVAAQIRRNANPFSILDQHTTLHEKGKSIASGSDDLTEIQDSVFSHVNSKARFSELNSVFADNGLAHVLKGEPADQAEINMVLLAMLRGAGVDAFPLYISGRDFGRINKDFPSIYQFNRMLVVSYIEGEKYFMDASFENSMPDLIPVESYNEQGMILFENEHEWIDISPDRSLFDLEITVDARLTREGELQGTLHALSLGYPSQRLRTEIARGSGPGEMVRETFFDIYPDIELPAARITVNPDNRNEIEVETGFSIPGYAVTFTGGIEFRPMIVGYLLGNPFESTQRRVPITLDAPERLSINYRIELPAGFSPDVTGSTNSTSLHGASLFEEYHAEGNRIEYSFDIDINRKEFPAEVYSQLRRIYERWVFLSNDTWFIQN